MPELVEPLGHADVVRGLIRSARAEQLPHALLFDGPAGIGKFRAAVWLAATLLCDAPAGEARDAPCGACGPCTRVRRDSHADLFVVDHRAAGQDALTIHFVTKRDPRPKEAYQGPPIDEFLSLRSAEGRGKYVIVREADRMNEEAQNAFLKMLEEPRPNVHLLLESGAPGALLATVRSRVVPVRFAPLDAALVKRVLDGLGEGGDDLDVASRMAAGSPGAALRLVARSAPAMQRILASVLAGETSAADGAHGLFDLDGDFPGKTPSAERRSRARTILDLGLELLLDVERVAAGVPREDLPHGEAAARVLAGPRLASAHARRAAQEAWLVAREDLNLNLAPEALVDRVLTAGR